MERYREMEGRGVDLTEITRIEDFTTEQLDEIREVVLYYAQQVIEISITQIFIVGSYCFNRENHIPGDMDIVVIVSESYQKIIYPSDEGIGYNIINAMAEKEREMRNNNHFGKKVQIIPNNYETFNSLTGDAPYYDLFNHELHNKEPYEVYPYVMGGYSDSIINWVHVDSIT